MAWYDEIEATPISKTKAIEVLASVLALNSAEHIGAAYEHGSLRANTKEALGRNLGVAEAFGIEPEYRKALVLHIGSERLIRNYHAH